MNEPSTVLNKDAQDVKGRTVAEWTTLAISAAMVVSMLGLVTYLYVRGDSQPAIVTASAQLDKLRQDDSAYYVPVQVTNEGDRTVEDVTIEGELAVDGQVETAEITVTFLAGGERVTGAFVFSQDPSQGELTVRPISYKDP